MKICDSCRSIYPSGFTHCPKDKATLRQTAELMPGMVIRDKYEIVEKIGAGGMASVYRARHLAFNEPRAIKVVCTAMMHDENFLRRFRNEAIITRKLQHYNAVRVDDIDTTDDGHPYIVMELVEGPNLRAVIEQEGPFPIVRALDLTRQVASALGAAHKLGITHRDIKPDNIVLVPMPDGGDLVKVLDFGIAKLRETGVKAKAYTATQSGMVIGTPQYISPEQASGGHGDKIDGRADLYSLGIVLYQMLTARLPFESDTPVGMLIHHLQTPAPPPSVVRPDLHIPEPISRLLLKSLEKNPNDRFQTAGELIAALDNPEQWAADEDMTCVMQALPPFPPNPPKVNPSKPAVTTVALPTPTTTPMTAPSAAPASAELTPEEMNRAAALLTRHVGPISRVLVKRLAPRASSLRMFYQLLGEHVDNKAERARFLRDAGFPES
jgi:serine/threonine-protein kinase